MNHRRPTPNAPLTALLFACLLLLSPPRALRAQDAYGIPEHYTKYEVQIPMRDGVKLFTAIYVPKEATQRNPILLQRTPYTSAPYGKDAYKTALGPSPAFAREGYIFVYQDVRGKFLSEGEYLNMRPETAGTGSTRVDESTDTYDTIDWLVKNIPNNNGRVGMWGISYPGFYAACGIIDSHPALKAASPQAPISDWFIGDDFHHNGALFLLDGFSFLSGFGVPRHMPTTDWGEPVHYEAPDVYKFFLELGPLPNANARYFKGRVGFWNDMMQHPNYDTFWRDRNLLTHIKNVHTAVMLVGGWFDAEDLYGPLKIFKTLEEKHLGPANTLVMGPWFHGGWERSDGDHLGDVSFGSKTAVYYREKVELPFFNHYLKEQGDLTQPRVLVYETGTNQWRTYDRWPPPNLQPRDIYLAVGKRLTFEAPAGIPDKAADSYVSDPANPVPYTPEILDHRTREYMTHDQRFAAARPDVLTYQTDPLPADLRLAGPIQVDLYASTSGTDADFVVKVIDVYPDDAPDNDFGNGPIKMGGYEMLLRGDIMRARFRRSYSRPEPMEPNQPTAISFELRDVCHTFLKGHRIMVQVQSSWFPLADRNPQTYVDIYRATDADFHPATLHIYRSPQYPSHLHINIQQ